MKKILMFVLLVLTLVGCDNQKYVDNKNTFMIDFLKFTCKVSNSCDENKNDLSDFYEKWNVRIEQKIYDDFVGHMEYKTNKELKTITKRLDKEVNRSRIPQKANMHVKTKMTVIKDAPVKKTIKNIRKFDDPKWKGKSGITNIIEDAIKNNKN